MGGRKGSSDWVKRVLGQRTQRDQGTVRALRALGSTAPFEPTVRRGLVEEDEQKYAVYAAEQESMVEGQWFGTRSEVQDFVDEVVWSNFWRARFPEHTLVTVKRVESTDGWVRGAAGHLGGRATGTICGTLWLPEETFYERYVLHEMAHVPRLPQKDHGPEFCRIYLDLVEAFMGQDDARWLAHWFRKKDIQIASRKQPHPYSRAYTELHKRHNNRKPPQIR